MIKVCTFLMSLLIVPVVFAQGFVGGDQYEISEWQGNVNVVCRDSSAFYFCRAQVVSPDPFQAFTHPNAPQADEVMITARRADGSQRDQSRRFDSTTGLSRNFNLLVWTLFQRPLLLEGTNNLAYELTNQGVVVDFGEFDVEVKRDSRIQTCQSRTVFSSDNSLCSNQALACDRYFALRPSCRY